MAEYITDKTDQITVFRAWFCDYIIPVISTDRKSWNPTSGILPAIITPLVSAYIFDEDQDKNRSIL